MTSMQQAMIKVFQALYIISVFIFAAFNGCDLCCWILYLPLMRGFPSASLKYSSGLRPLQLSHA